MTCDDEEVPKHSIEHLTDEVEGLRRTLVWLIETQTGEPEAPCATCGHDAFDHADDEGAVGPCYFPRWRHLGKSGAAPLTLCRCQALT